MKNPSIKGVEFLSILIKFEVPIDRNLYDLGSVHLQKDGRNFVLDVCKSFTNEESTEIECLVEVDTETFPLGEDTNYKLTAVDLSSGIDYGSLYIGTEYEEAPQSISLFVKINGMTKAIDLNID
jgi:hypothetical protein